MSCLRLDAGTICIDWSLHLTFVFNGILYTPRCLEYVFTYDNFDCDHSF